MCEVNNAHSHALAMTSGRSESLQRRRSNPPSSSSFNSLQALNSQFLFVILTLALFVSPGCGSLHTVARAKVLSPSLSHRLRSTPLSMGRGLQTQAQAQAKRGHRDLAPVVIVPGTGGNQLEARLTADYEAAKPWCYSFRKEYFRLWLDVKTLLPPFTACFADRLSLDYNPETDSYSNIKGVETRVPYFGTTEGMEYLDPSLK